jgi:uracil-DNA glycosylase
MSDKINKLISQTLQFLEKERELFGDFRVTKSVDQTSETKSQHSKDEIKIDPSASQKPISQPQDCQTLEQLQKLCESAEELKTDLKGTNLVFGTGNPHADLMLIGEAPGYHENKQGEPFVGNAGQLLNKILEAINFNREDVYIANILKHRPPDNRDPKPEERARSLPYLIRQIELIDPKLILCLGRVSATTLLNRDETLKDMRGKFHSFMGRQLMVTYHPAALLHHPEWKRPVWEDVQLLRKKYEELVG